MASPELGERVVAGGIATNVHVRGTGSPLVLLHGSGPGVSAWANWRLNLPVLAETHRVIAPDLVGFGFTERPADQRYSKEKWFAHVDGVFDVLEIGRADIVGNSFGGAIALAYAIARPERVRRLVLMGAVGTRFEITRGLDAVWGYQPSFEAMRALLDIFAWDRNLVSDELAQLRYQASIQPGFQESFSAMFPAPRQRWVDQLASSDAAIKAVQHPTLVIHGRDDQVIPLAASQRLAELLPNAELHVFNHCGHWTQIEKTARFNSLVRDFIS